MNLLVLFLTILGFTRGLRAAIGNTEEETVCAALQTEPASSAAPEARAWPVH